MATGLAVWLGSANSLYGGVTVATTGQILPCVYGTVASAFSPVLYSLVLSFVQPQNFTWADFRAEKLAFDSDDDSSIAVTVTPNGEDLYHADGPEAQAYLKRWARIAAFWSLATFFGHWVLWPLPMYASKYIFSKEFFIAWLVVAIIWIWGTLFVVGVFPVVDGYRQFIQVWRALRQGNKSPTRHNEQAEAWDDSTGSTATPVHIEGKQ